MSRSVQLVFAVAMILAWTINDDAFAQQSYVDLKDFVSSKLVDSSDMEREARIRLARRYPVVLQHITVGKSKPVAIDWETVPIALSYRRANYMVLEYKYSEPTISDAPGQAPIYRPFWNCTPGEKKPNVTSEDLKSNEKQEKQTDSKRVKTIKTLELKYTSGLGEAKGTFQQEVETYMERVATSTVIESQKKTKTYTVTEPAHTLVVLEVDSRIKIYSFDVTAIMVADAKMFARAKNPKTGKEEGDALFIGDWSSFWGPERRKLPLKGRGSVLVPPTNAIVGETEVSFESVKKCLEVQDQYAGRELTIKTLIEIGSKYGKNFNSVRIAPLNPV